MPLIKPKEACPLTEYVVRATSFEQHCVWRFFAAGPAIRYTGLRGVSWDPQEPGRLVAFVDPWSRKMDLAVLEAWIKTTFPAARSVLNAENFGQIYAEVTR